MPATTSKLTVKIREKHIRSGQRLGIMNDPISLALFDMGYRAWTGKDHVVFCAGMKKVQVPLTVRACQWVRRFDAKKKCVPFQFTLRVPVEIL